MGHRAASASGSASNTGPVVIGAIGAGSRVEYSALGRRREHRRAPAVRTPSRARVLVGEATRRQIGPLFTWGPPRSLELKGKDAPVTAFEVTGIDAARRPGPATGAAPRRIVGRDASSGAAARRSTPS